MKKILKYSVIAFFIFAGLGSVKAQQNPQYTQYMFNGLAINPAYAGSRDVLSIVALYRKQWVGLEGAPQTMVFSAHSPVLDEQFALGVQVTDDRIGVNKQTNLTFSGSYWIPLNHKEGRLSFGLQGGVNNYVSDNTSLNLVNPDEDNFASNISSLKPNIGVGVYYYSKKFFLGLSTLELIKNTHVESETSSFEQFRHLFLYTGHIFDLNEDWKIKPTLLFKGVVGAPVEVDVTAHFLYKEKLWLGAAWRSGASVDFLAHYMITEELGIGYAYDFSTTKLRQYNSGSHEILLRFEPSFGKNKSIKSPRFF